MYNIHEYLYLILDIQGILEGYDWHLDMEQKSLRRSWQRMTLVQNLSFSFRVRSQVSSGITVVDDLILLAFHEDLKRPAQEVEVFP